MFKYLLLRFLFTQDELDYIHNAAHACYPSGGGSFGHRTATKLSKLCLVNTDRMDVEGIERLQKIAMHEYMEGLYQ